MRKINFLKIGMLLLLLILGLGMYFIYQDSCQQRMQQELSEKILRFHVRANSDSSQDQALKLKVRDAVGAYMQKALEDVDDIEACRQVVSDHLPDIIKAAEETIQEEGYSYPVKADIGTTEFPVKHYGAYTFPAGSYEALNIIIGSGKGHNWWCVMYPNMCFHGSVYEVVDEDAKKELKRVLTEEEYDAVLKSGQYKVRFKYLEFLNQFFRDEH